MELRKLAGIQPILALAAAMVMLFIVGSFLLREPTAFGGNFGPMAQPQQTGHYQIASRDGNSAWVIDTIEGDVFLIFADGKWKDVGSILDDKKRMRKPAAGREK